MCKSEQHTGKRAFRKRSVLEDLKGQGGAAAACRFRVHVARSHCLKHWSECVVGMGLVESEAVRKFCEKGQLVPFLPVLLTFLLPNNCLSGQLGISLASGNTWPSGFQQY